MNISAGLGIGTEIASASHHTLSRWEQFRQGGEVNACAAVMRATPDFIRTFVRKRLLNETLPFVAVGVDWQPEMYGNQTVVYGNAAFPELVLKVGRPGRDHEADLQRAKEGVALLGEYAALHTVSTSVIVIEQMTGPATASTALLQERVSGRDFYNGGAEKALPSEIHSLYNANQKLMQHHNRLVDLDGAGNVLVTDDGHIKIVDVGLSSVESLQTDYGLQDALGVLTDYAKTYDIAA